MEGDPATRIGPYEIGEELGRGGFGSVYRARDASTGREVALKVLREDPGDGALPARRFLRETSLVRELDHPAILKVLDASREDEKPLWVAFELVEGVPLWKLLAEEPLEWRRAAEIARDVAAALGHAHAKGILHRDVKPGNILVGRKWGDEDVADGAPGNARSAFLTDFGLARVTDTRSRLTVTGMAIGTPEYMSPEQARGETTSLSPATDVWAVGVVLYEMLAGRLPFEGDSPESVIEKVVLREPVGLRKLRSGVPAGLDRVVRACLAKRRESRYPDGTALQEDLDRVLRGENARASPPHRWRGPAIAAGMAALLAGAVALRPGSPRSASAPAEARSAPSAAEALAGRAARLRGSDPVEAARLLQQALAEDLGHPDADRWRLERGLLLWSVGYGDEAQGEWLRIAPGSPLAPPARLYRGLEAILRIRSSAERRQAGTAELEAAASGEGREGRLARGTLAAFGHRWDEARRALRDETGWEAALLRGYVEGLDPAGDRAAVVRELGEALAAGLPFSWAHNNRGAALLELGDAPGALAEFDAALRLRPDDPGALLNRGIARLGAGDPRGARDDLTTLLRDSPGDSAASHQRGIARMRLGDTVGALADFTASLEGRPRDPDTRYNRGNAHVALGDLAAAERDYTIAIEARPDFHGALTNRGNVRWNQGNESGALEDYDAALRIAPGESRALNNRGRLHLRHGRLEAADADLRAARKSDPSFPDPLYNLGIVHQKRREWEEAIQLFSEFLRMAPTHAAAEEARLRRTGCEQGAQEESGRPR
ncbi:MAG: protein kinase [Planctomycetales bacterium]|nr:protein kinase [Planctomycetales bacterium]